MSVNIVESNLGKRQRGAYDEPQLAFSQQKRIRLADKGREVSQSKRFKRSPTAASVQAVNLVNPDFLERLRDSVLLSQKQTGGRGSVFSDLKEAGNLTSGTMIDEDLLVSPTKAMERARRPLTLQESTAMSLTGSAPAVAPSSSAPVDTSLRAHTAMHYNLSKKQLALTSVLAKQITANTSQLIVGNYIDKARLASEIEKRKSKDVRRSSNHSCGALTHDEVNNHYLVKNWLPPAQYLHPKNEWKSFDWNFSHAFVGTSLSSQVFVEQLINTYASAQSYGVVGNRLHPHLIELRYQLIPHTTASNNAYTAQSIPMSFRIALVWDYQPNLDVKTTFGDIFVGTKPNTGDDGSTPLTSAIENVNTNNFKRYNVLLDEIVQMPGTTFTTSVVSSSTSNNSPPEVYGSFKINVDELNSELRSSKLREPMVTTYLSNQSSINENTITTGQLYLVVAPVVPQTVLLANNNSLPMPELYATTRLYYS